MNQPSSKIIPRITTAVAVAAETPIEELPPLADAIDPDGFDALVTGEPSHDVTIIFAYAGQRVLVHADKTVYVRPIRDTRPDTDGEPPVADN